MPALKVLTGHSVAVAVPSSATLYMKPGRFTARQHCGMVWGGKEGQVVSKTKLKLHLSAARWSCVKLVARQQHLPVSVLLLRCWGYLMAARHACCLVQPHRPPSRPLETHHKPCCWCPSLPEWSCCLDIQLPLGNPRRCKHPQRSNASQGSLHTLLPRWANTCPQGTL